MRHSSSAVDLSHFAMMCGLIFNFVGFSGAFAFLFNFVLISSWVVPVSVGAVVLGTLLFVVSALLERCDDVSTEA